MYISFGTMLASGGRDGSIRIWDASSGVGLAELMGAHSDSVRGMACGGTGRLLATASADMSIKVWHEVLLNSALCCPLCPLSSAYSL